jgi:predicted hotdog family 3-hydroxylacyl-ACP dehydratase
MTLDREWIEAHVPQQDGMCLLDEVLSWDGEQVLARSGTHRRASHPLRSHGRLASVCAIEYAAQAAALHGALLEPHPHGGARAGLLISVRSVELAVARLDTLAGDLLVHARRIESDARGAIYGFEVSEQRAAGPAVRLATGRLSLWLELPLGTASP